MRRHSLGPGAFPSRGRVGWLARSASVSGRRPRTSFQERVLPQGVGVVLVLVAGGYLQDPLAYQRREGVPDGRPPPLRHVGGDLLAQAQLPVHLGEPEEAAVGGDAAAVEGGFEGERGGGFKAHARCGRIGHQGAPPLVSFEATRPRIQERAPSLQVLR